jgi:copper chaperone CopZ
MKLLLLFAAAMTMNAEFLRMEVFMKDMNCPSCSESLAKAFEKMRGVTHVEVSMKDGTVTLDLADRNRIAIEQVWDTVKRIGFTPGETKVTVRGAVKGASLTVLDRKIDIDGPALEGEEVTLKGIITPPADPRATIRLRIAG